MTSSHERAQLLAWAGYGLNGSDFLAKLGLDQQGELMLYVLQHGHVLVTETGILYPEFQRRPEKIRGAKVACERRRRSPSQ